eukprot:TRINITY_DN5644_c0_g2_i3.p1 TRINITY_DN5644_c0_g2~~TRINITY_DN5644_c0_g2_i3.p1  ORF type:complete len:635 (-),score=132.92 TRINITY_DN5644_c0_g2_i3:156-2060(-)
MFRASDVFGRQGARATAAAKAAAVQKRPAEDHPQASFSGPINRTWDPATGEYVEEEIPAEVLSMMGVSPKKPKVEVKQETHTPWGASSSGVLAPRWGNKKTSAAEVAQSKVDTGAPSVEFRGFTKVDLNDRYFERAGVNISTRPTYWTEDGQFFLYWQGAPRRWALCDADSFPAVRAGQVPGWAYKSDQKFFCQANSWMEATDGRWQEAALEVIYRSSSTDKPQWEDPILQKSITRIDIDGFSVKELNGRYYLRSSEIIQGQPSYWITSGVYFIYWQQQTRRWAICDLKCLDAVREGQCPGWAYRNDSGHFANACGWKESQAGQWVDARIETSVIFASQKGLKVEFSGFSKPELNTQYTEKSGEEVQGRGTFWDVSNNYFIYWQSSMKRWAICDSASFPSAQSGLSVGWAYRTDSKHFAQQSSGWLESWGREWRPAEVACVVLEGTVIDDSAFVKAEPSEDPGTLLTADQYKILIRKVYEEKNPAKLCDLDVFFSKYQGREHELFAQVCAKYEADAEALAAALPDTSSSDWQAAAVASAAPSTAKNEFAHLEDSQLPELPAQEYAILIQSAYERYKPEKVADMGRLLKKYRHRERELYLLVCDKYGANPARFYAEYLNLKAANESGFGVAAPVN